MDPTQKDLKAETEKWLAKLKEERPGVKVIAKEKAFEKAAKEGLKNMDAYIKDTAYFMEKGDFIRAFEAVVWAWGILETMEHAGLLERKTIK